MPRRTYVVVGIALALLVIVTVVFAALQWLVYSQSRQAPPPFSYTVAIDEPLTVCADGVLEIPVSGISAETVTRVTVYQDITTRQNTPVRDNIFDQFIGRMALLAVQRRLILHSMLIWPGWALNQASTFITV